MSDQYNEYNDQTKPEGEFVEEFEVKAEDAHLAAGEKFTPEQLGDAVIKFATETAYAAAGFANVLAEKAKVFYESQRKEIAAKTPEGVDPNFRQFVDAMPDQFKGFIDEAQAAAAAAAKERYQEAFSAAGYGDITTEIVAADDAPFYWAEAYHQQYLEKNPKGYCPIHATGVTCG